MLGALPLFMMGATEPPDLGSAPAAQVRQVPATLVEKPDILVTAQKRRQPISDVSLSITAIDGDALEQQGIRDIASFVNLVPGLTFTPSPFGQAIYTLRGIGYSESSLAAAPAVGIYLDEIPLAFHAMSEATLLDVERVEVLKGPQGALYGQNSTGGVINFITAKPTSRFEAGANLGFSRFNSAETSGFVSGPVTNDFRARVAVHALRGGSWQKSYMRDDTLGQTSQTMGRLSVDWTPTSRLAIAINLSGWHDGSDTLAGQVVEITPKVPSNFPGGLTLSPLTPRAADWTHGWPHRNDSYYQAAIRTEYSLSADVGLTSISAYQHLQEDKRTDLDANFLVSNNYRQFGKIDTFTQEFRLSSDSTALSWIVGANYAHSDIPDTLIGEIKDLSITRPIPSLPGFPEVGTRTRSRINSYAGFGNVEFEVADRVSLIGGLRYTQTNRRFAGCTYATTQEFADIFNAIQQGLILAGVKTTPIIPIGIGDCSNLDAKGDPALNRNSLSKQNLSFRLGVDYKSDGGSLFYGSISRGYKSGGSPVIPSSASSQLDPVTQERVIAYEAGIKVPLFDRRGQFNAASFYYDYKNKQLRGRVLDPIFFVLEQLVNIPKSRVAGGEMEFQIHPIDGLGLSLSGTYVDTKVIRYQGFNDDGVFLDYRGSPFAYTPKFQLVSNVDYLFKTSRTYAFSLGAGARYNSSSVATFLSPAFPQPSDAVYRMRPYLLVDLRFGIEANNGGWRASIWGRNVTNQYFWSNVFNTNDVKYRLPARPAEYGILFSVRFGRHDRRTIAPDLRFKSPGSR